MEEVIAYIIVYSLFAMIILLYLYTSLAKYRVLKVLGYSKTLVAFVPIMGSVVYTEKVVNVQEDGTFCLDNIRVPLKYFRYWSVVSSLLPFVPVCGWLLYWVFFIFCFGVTSDHFVSMFDNTVQDKKLYQRVCSSSLVPFVLPAKLNRFCRNGGVR